MAALKRMGCSTEIVSWRSRVFAPKTDTMERILDRCRSPPERPA